MTNEELSLFKKNLDKKTFVTIANEMTAHLSPFFEKHELSPADSIAVTMAALSSFYLGGFKDLNHTFDEMLGMTKSYLQLLNMPKKTIN